MGALERREACGFEIGDTHTLEEIEKMNPDERLGALVECEKLFASYPDVTLPPFYSNLCMNGCEIYQKKIRSSFAVGTLLRVYGDCGFIGVGEVKDYPDGEAIKIKIFL